MSLMKNNLIVFIVLIIVHICYPQNQFSAKKHAIIVGYNGINDSFTSDYLFFNKETVSIKCVINASIFLIIDHLPVFVE